MAFIEATHLTKIYHTDGIETPALRGVSFEIQKGEFVAIMGASGSGKSTLLHILGFLDRETDGEYRLNGKTADDYSGDEVATLRNTSIGFIFQAFNLLPRTTVLDNVRLPLLYSNVSSVKWDEHARRAIDSVGLSHRMLHESSQLSGGEKQRVAIARALVNHPELILADEPTGNLDSKSGQQVMEILHDLNESHGHTIILITHETYTAEHARRIIKLHDGEIASDAHVKARHHAREFVK